MLAITMNHLPPIILIIALSIQGCAARLPTTEGKPRIPINAITPDTPITKEDKEAGNANIK